MRDGTRVEGVSFSPRVASCWRGVVGWAAELVWGAALIRGAAIPEIGDCTSSAITRRDLLHTHH